MMVFMIVVSIAVSKMIHVYRSESLQMFVDSRTHMWIKPVSIIDAEEPATWIQVHDCRRPVSVFLLSECLNPSACCTVFI